MPQGSPDDVATLIETQRHYYDLRAPDHGDPNRPSDRKRPGHLGAGEAGRLVDELDPQGDVLELACGTGGFTRDLIRHTSSLTALDGSPTMLALNRGALGDERIDYVHADIFDWRPTRRFDVVFFGFWLSHVPPSHFDSFWSTVRSCLKPGGRVGFVDEDERGRDHEAAVLDTAIPMARRTLGDGRTFDIIKVFWEPADLEQRLHTIGWDARVRSVGESFLYGTAHTDE